MKPSADDESGPKRVEDLSPNGRRYAVAGDPANQIRLWDISSSPAPEVPLKGHGGDVRLLSFDPSSDFLASADGSEVIIWSAKERAMVKRIPLRNGYATRRLAVSPEGRYIATSSGGKTLLWDTTSKDLARPLPVEGTEGTTSLTFSPDRRWLSIGNQNEIKLWNLDTRKIDWRIPIPTSGTIKFSPNSALLAVSHSNSIESEVTVWNVRGQIAGTVIVDSSDSEDAFAFTPNSARLAVVGHDGVSLWPFDAPWALRHVCRITGRNLTPEGWDQHAQGFDYIATCP